MNNIEQLSGFCRDSKITIMYKCQKEIINITNPYKYINGQNILPECTQNTKINDIIRAIPKSIIDQGYILNEKLEVCIKCIDCSNYFELKKCKNYTNISICNKCIAKRKHEKLFNERIEELKSRYKDVFSYDLATYSDFSNEDKKYKIIITCVKHGNILINFYNHYSLNNKCRKCFNERTSYHQIPRILNSPNMHSLGNLYVFRVTHIDTLETFIKVGVTVHRDPHTRYAGLDYLNFNFLLLYTNTDSNINNATTESYILEDENNIRYNPICSFIGYTECFSRVMVKGIWYE